MLGALMVEAPDGLHFGFETGFADFERELPPVGGDWVIYHFAKLTT